MSEQIEMSLGVALVLDEVARKVLYAVKEENGQQVIVDRELPFRLRYRLNKNKLMLDKDVEWFNQKKLLLLAQYGAPDEDGKGVSITDPEKLEKYKEEIGALIDSKVKHEFAGLEPSDIEMVQDPDITVSPEAMSLFIGYLTNDPALEKDLSFEIRCNPVVPPAPKKEEKTTEIPTSGVEVEPKKKETTKKTTTAKKAEDKPAEKAEKKPTTKKSTTKKTTKKDA